MSTGRTLHQAPDASWRCPQNELAAGSALVSESKGVWLSHEEGTTVIRVYTDMVADLFHYGHMEFLKQARALGDYLLVGVCADDIVEAQKRRPILTMEERVVSVAGCRYVDEVIPNAPWRFDPAWVEKYDIHLVVHGDDYTREQQEHYYGVPIEKGIFRTLPYTKGISTTEIIDRCQAAGRVDVQSWRPAVGP